MNERKRLEGLSRSELVRLAREAGVPDDERLTHTELVERVLDARANSPLHIARSIFSRAKDIAVQAVVVAKTLYDETKGPSATRERQRSAPPPTPPPAPPAPPQEEPAADPAFETATLAKVYETQGHIDQALKMYEAVLERDPSDDAAREGLERIKTEPAPEATAAIEPDPGAAVLAQEIEVAPAQPSRAAPGDSLELVAVDPATLHCAWALEDGGVARASAFLGTSGRLVLRLFGSYPSATGTETLVRDEEIDELRGDRFLRGVPGAGLYLAAVGLLAGERFVPVVRAGPVRTPAGMPATEVTRAALGFGPDPLRPEQSERERHGRSVSSRWI